MINIDHCHERLLILYDQHWSVYHRISYHIMLHCALIQRCTHAKVASPTFLSTSHVEHLKSLWKGEFEEEIDFTKCKPLHSSHEFWDRCCKTDFQVMCWPAICVHPVLTGWHLALLTQVTKVTDAGAQQGWVTGWGHWLLTIHEFKEDFVNNQRPVALAEILLLAGVSLGLNSRAWAASRLLWRHFYVRLPSSRALAN